MTNLKLWLFCCLFPVFTTFSYSQWTPTSGPEGGRVSDIIKLENTLVINVVGEIYTSIDNGETWEVSTSGLPEGAFAFKIATDGNVIYASLDTYSIYKSTDQGNSWFLSYKPVDFKTFYNVFIDGNFVYASTDQGEIYRSQDAGASWALWSAGINDEQINDFAIFNSKLYVSTSNGVYENDGDGDVWNQIDIPGLTFGAYSINTQNGVFYVGSSSSGKVFVSNDNMLTWTENVAGNGTIIDIAIHDDIIYSLSPKKCYYSNDNGITWNEIAVTTENRQHSFGSFYQSMGKFIITSTAGNYESTDNGATWTLNTTGIKKQVISSFGANDTYLFAGTTSNGVFRSSDNGASWVSVNSGLNDNNTLNIQEILTVENTLIIATGGGVYSSNDNGDTWEKKIDPGINIATSALDYSNGILVSGVRGDGIYLSYDLGETWEVIVPQGLGTEESYGSIALEGSTMLLNSNNREVFLSTDLGETWNPITTLEDSIFIEDIEIVNGILFISDYQGLHKSSDMGQTWTTYISSDLSIVENITVDGDVLYLATQKGFKATTVDRNVWYSFADGMGNIGTTTAFLKDNYLFAGTYRYSVWSRPVSEIVIPIADDDNDGVVNTNDLCPNTYPGNVVNEDGCDLIAADAISVVGKSPSCPNVDNAKIEVGTTLSGYVFDISLEGEGVSQSFQSVSLDVDFTLDGLAPGTYEVVISIPEIRYEQLFGLNINEIDNISGKRNSVDKNSKTAKYVVSGSKEYLVNVNGLQRNYYFESEGENEILIQNLESFNTVRILGKRECQGIIEDKLILETEIQVFPTITSGMLSIAGESKITHINIYNAIGQLVLRKKINSLENYRTIHLEGQSAGLYIVHVVGQNNIKRFKIIKQ